MLANEQTFLEVGKSHKVPIQIQELELQTDFCTLPLEEMNMVLGVEWLM